MKKQIIDAIIRLSRGQDIDLSEYRRYLTNLDKDVLLDIRDRKRYYKSAAYEKDVQREINKLDRAGMFNIRNMKPENALD